MNLFECANSACFNMRLHETRLSCLILCCFFIACAVLIVLDRTMLDRNRRMIQMVQPVDLTPITVTLDVTPNTRHHADRGPLQSKVQSCPADTRPIVTRKFRRQRRVLLRRNVFNQHQFETRCLPSYLVQTSLSPHRLKCHLVQQRAWSTRDASTM